MSKFNDAMIDGLLDRISQIEPKASSTERAMDKVRQKLMEDMPVRTGIFQMRFVKMAIAAAIIAAVGIAIALLISNTNPETVPEQKNIVENQQPGIPIPSMPTVAEQLAKVEGLYAAGDVDGLIAALDSDEPAVAAASAGFLGQIGDERAIEALSSLAGKWKGSAENPFQKAIDDITKRIDGGPDDTSSEPVAEAGEPNSPEACETVREYEQPQYVHITYTQVMFSGESGTYEAWFKMPDHMYESNPENITVDDGVERLTLNVKEKTALFEDSWMKDKPLSKHHMLETMNMFRGEMPEEVTYTKNDKESNAKKIVYDLEIDSTPPGVGKAWVNPETMLPNKMTAEIGQDPNNPDPEGQQSVIATFDYSPFSDKVFAMDVPKDYTELPRKKAEAFTGQVVDEMGDPVAGAKVYIRSWALTTPDKQLSGVSDQDGFFAISLPINRGGLGTPIPVYAVIPGDDERIGWTLLRSDDQRANTLPFGGEIPGDPGVFDSTERYIKKASGILLQMEKAGRIFGMVTNTLGEPIANAQVEVEFDLTNTHGYEKVSSHYMWPTVTHTDADGYYMVGNLPRLWKNTKRYIGVSAKGYNSKTMHPVSEGPLDEMQANVELLLSGITVHGTVIDNYGKPLDRRHVIVSAGNGNSLTGGNTDKDGKFEITGCATADKLTVTAELVYNRQQNYDKDDKTRASYVYYPNTSAEIVLEEERIEYEVELVAELPEFTVEVYVVDSAGDALPYYPVELMGGGGLISREWKEARNLHTRTDKNGYCKLTGVPNLKGMCLVFYMHSYVPSDKNLDEETKKLMGQVSQEYGRKYTWTQVDIEVVEGVKNYEITALIPTKEEAEKERQRQQKLEEGKP